MAVDRPPNTGAGRPPLRALTGLRFVAAAWVVIAHYQHVVTYPPGLRQVAGYGAAGVCLFFVLSGFILVYNYLDWFTGDLARIGSFLRARFARIYPLYLLGLLVMTPVALLVPHAPLSDMGHHSPAVLVLSWLTNLLLVQAFLPRRIFHVWDAPGWSLSAEWSFYLVFPFFVRLVLARLRGPRSLIALFLGLYAMQVALYGAVTAVLQRSYSAGQFRQLMDFFVYFSPALRIWEFLIGCTLGLLFLRLREREGGRLLHLARSRRLRDAGLALVLAACVALPLAMSGVFGAGYAVTGFHWYALFTPLFGLLILLLALGPTFLSPVLEHPVAILLGEASYSLYILHWIPFTPLSYRVATGRSVGMVWAAVAMVGTLAVSVVTYQCIEVPARRYLRTRPAVRPPLRATLRLARRTFGVAHV